jgi:hypothetical protein
MKTHFMFSNFENRAVHEIWKNTLLSDKPQMAIWPRRIACCIHKATNTPLEYVVLIAISMWQWFHESVAMLRYTYIVRPVGF